MNHAEVCPVCKGSGKRLGSPPPSTVAPTEHPCHGCGGLGWITVADGPSRTVVVPYIPFLPYHPPLPYPWTVVWPPGITITCKIEP